MAKKIFFICLVIAVSVAAVVHAQDKRLEAELEMDQVSPGNPLYLYITFYGAHSVNPPDVPRIDGLQIKYVGPSTKVSVINGQVSRSITHMYIVIPLREGEYDLGPFSVKHEGRTYTSNVARLSASRTPSPGARPSVPTPSGVPDYSDQRQRIYAGDRLFLKMETNTREVYLNEVVPITVKLYVQRMSLRDIEFPVYNHDGFSASKMEEPQRHRETVGGMPYDVLVFRQELFAIKEGEHTLGPASIKAKVVTKADRVRRRASIFGRSLFRDDFLGDIEMYPVQLQSDPVKMTVLPFPGRGRPDSFKGAVGNFGLEVNVEPKTARVGDPVVMRMVIRGTGNLDTVTAPVVEESGDFKTYEPQVTRKGASKIYEQILIPNTDGTLEVPRVSFSFFDPLKRQYVTLEEGPIPVEVTKQPEGEKAVTMVAVPGMTQLVYPEERLGRDIIHIKDNIGTLRRKGTRLYKNSLFWTGQALPGAAFLVFFFMYRRRERMRTDIRYARFFHAPRKAKSGLGKAKAFLDKGDAPRFYDSIFKTLQDYLGDKFDLPKGSITSQIIENRLRPAGYDEHVLEMLHEVFLKCEMTRYASSMPAGAETEKVLDNVERIIDYFEKAKV